MISAYYFCINISFAPHAFTILLLAYICSYILDHMESKLEEPTEQAQAEDFTNLLLDQSNLWCI
jgi:hypothetical protein